MVIDTACSSTMVALHQAVLSLKTKEAGMALVCGANLILNPDMVSILFSVEMQPLPPTHAPKWGKRVIFSLYEIPHEESKTWSPIIYSRRS